MINTKIIITIVAVVAGTAGIFAYKYSVNVKTSLSIKSSAEAGASSSAQATMQTSIKIQQSDTNNAIEEDGYNKDFFKGATEYTKVKPKTLEELGAKEMGK